MTGNGSSVMCLAENMRPELGTKDLEKEETFWVSIGREDRGEKVTVDDDDVGCRVKRSARRRGGVVTLLLEVDSLVGRVTVDLRGRFLPGRESDRVAADETAALCPSINCPNTVHSSLPAILDLGVLRHLSRPR